AVRAHPRPGRRLPRPHRRLRPREGDHPMTTHALTGPAPSGLRFHPLRDSTTMLRRNLKHMLRYPSMTVLLVGMPIVFLLLFVYVFGGTMGAGLPGASGGRAAYANYVAPAIILM